MEKGRKGRKEREGVERRREGKKIKWCWLVCFSLPPILLPFLFLLSLSFVIFFFLISFHLPCSIPVSFVLLLLVRSIKVYALPSTRLASPSHLSSHFFFFFFSPPDISSSTNRKARQLRFSQSSFPLLCREHQLFYGERTRMRLGACTSTPTDTPKNWLYTCTHTHARTHAHRDRISRVHAGFCVNV